MSAIMDQADTTYRRGQVEWALWRFFTLLRPAAKEPPKVFLTRIKRLLEADRLGRFSAGLDYKPDSDFAFSSAKTEGQGVDATFSAFDAFCLALALDLLDVGLKPSETVFLLRYLRTALAVEFKAILRDPPPPPRQRPAKDNRVFWIIQKVELTEIYDQATPRRKGQKTPIFLEPKFCHGAEDLLKELDQMNWTYRKALVVEIAYLADNLTQLLAKAPLKKRGR
jgi:hypothetical protein